MSSNGLIREFPRRGLPLAGSAKTGREFGCKKSEFLVIIKVEGMDMQKDRLLELIKNALSQDPGVIFAYAFGSFLREGSYRDIDIGVYVKNSQDHPFAITSELKNKLSRLSKESGFDFAADQFDVRILNEAPFTFLRRVFKEGILLVDLDPDLRTDLIEHVSRKYRECAGILAEASTG